MTQLDLFVRPYVRASLGRVEIVHGHRRHRPVYYASGSNRAGEIRALHELLHPIGVSAREVTRAR